jgi:glycosyltransferase involved in cell wall biosynthesis
MTEPAIMKTVSCIIPAYNESKRLASVLSVVGPLVGSVLEEVIVVDDGSTDNTSDIAAGIPNITLIRNETNKGKSATVMDGVAAAKGEYIFLLDADLSGLQASTITALLAPIIDDRADVSIGYRSNTPRWFISLVGIEILGGDRVLKKSLFLEHASDIRNLPGYGLEVFLNTIIIQSRLRIASISMQGVCNEFKWRKHGLRGIVLEIRMWTRNILRVIPWWGFFYQNYAMRRLLIK